MANKKLKAVKLEEKVSPLPTVPKFDMAHPLAIVAHNTAQLPTGETATVTDIFEATPGGLRVSRTWQVEGKPSSVEFSYTVKPV